MVFWRHVTFSFRKRRIKFFHYAVMTTFIVADGLIEIGVSSPLVGGGQILDRKFTIYRKFTQES